MEKRVASTTFTNECNCLTTKDWAKKIEENKGLYRVESPVFFALERNDIRSVLYKNVDDDVAAYWGVIKVSYNI